MEKFSSKILLFGEYSLLYNSMALTMPYKKYAGTWSVSDDRKHPLVKYSNDCLRKFAFFLSNNIDKNFELNTTEFLKDVEKGLFYDSNIPQGYGLGSSGSLVAAVFMKYIKARNNLNDILNDLTTEKVEHLRIALGKIESYFHGASSGIDPLSILLDKPLLYKSKDEIALTQLPKYKEDGKNKIFLLNTKLERNTDELVKKFKNKCKTTSFRDQLTQELIPQTNASITAFLNKNSREFYQHLNELIQFQLKHMDYLIPSIYQKLIQQGVESEDYFLKICGAGGGGFMLGFTQDWEKTQNKLKNHPIELIYKY